MRSSSKRDRVRQVAGLVAAVFQTAAGVFFTLNLSAEPVADQRGSTLIDPAGYAFIVWAPILLSCLAYAIYQALPAQRANPLLRRVGWPLVGAFICNGLWELASPLGQLGVAQLLIAGIFAFLAVAYLRLVRVPAQTLSRADRWLVAVPVGIYFGWITAANAVSATSLAARTGLVAGTDSSGILLGGALLLLGGIAAAILIRTGKNGSPYAYAAYGTAVLWALAGVITNQYTASTVTTAIAAICAAAVLLALLWRSGRIARPQPPSPVHS